MKKNQSINIDINLKTLITYIYADFGVGRSLQYLFLHNPPLNGVEERAGPLIGGEGLRAPHHTVLVQCHYHRLQLTALYVCKFSSTFKFQNIC